MDDTQQKVDITDKCVGVERAQETVPWYLLEKDLAQKILVCAL